LESLGTSFFIIRPNFLSPEVAYVPLYWSEWNYAFQDTVRSFWCDGGAKASDLAMRLSGSGDLYCQMGRGVWTSINFVTSHNGFTLLDSFSYREKHNEENMQNNQDGGPILYPVNCGEEGETDDENINRVSFCIF
jgi:isoamylase